MQPNQAVVATLVVCAGAFWIAIDLPEGAESVRAASAAPPPAARASEEPNELETAATVPAASIGAREAVRKRVDVPESNARGFTPGHLILRAVDRDTGRPLDSFTVRLASETRFAEESHTDPASGPDDPRGALDLPLTPATYDGLVMSPGYEPFQLQPIRLGSGETVELGPVALFGGFGTIRVGATRAAGSDGLSVALRGIGRRPCPLCEGSVRPNPRRKVRIESRCTSCGFDESDTRLKFGPDGRVQFHRLASGPYALRVVDSNDRAIGDDRSVDLGYGEAAFVPFDVSQSRTVEVEMVDSDGVSLSSEWGRRLAATQVDEDSGSFQDVASFGGPSVNEIPIQLEFRMDCGVIALAQFVPPAPPGARMFCSRSIGCGIGRRVAARPTVDRARGPGDSLWPQPAVPGFEASRVACDLDSKGIAILTPVTTSQLALHLKAGDLVAEAIVPPERGPTRLRVQLRSLQAPSSQLPAPPLVTYRALESTRDR